MCKEGILGGINAPLTSFFKDKNSCTNRCIPKNKFDGTIITPTTGTSYFGSCNYGTNASRAIDACNNLPKPLDPLYNSSCGPQFEGGSVKHDSNCFIYCDCNRVTKDNTIYIDG